MEPHLKLRAWHEKSHAMYPVTEILWDFNGTDESKPAWVRLGDSKLVPADDVKLMIATSINDSTGKLIYESDVLDIRIYGNSTKMIVEWDVDGWKIPRIVNKDLGDFVKILGNIYENPSLDN